MMELTLGNLISFLKKKVTYDGFLSTLTVLRQHEDGIAAVYLLEDLEKEFNITFKNFDFHEYFLDEDELSSLTWNALFKREKQREIKEELTVQKLFEYMIANKKSPE